MKIEYYFQILTKNCQKSLKRDISGKAVYCYNKNNKKLVFIKETVLHFNSYYYKIKSNLDTNE